MSSVPLNDLLLSGDAIIGTDDLTNFGGKKSWPADNVCSQTLTLVLVK